VVEKSAFCEAVYLVRILFVSSGLGYGGAETQLIAYVRELRKIGHEVAIFLLTSHVPRLPEIQSCGVTAVVGDKQGRLDLSLLLHLRQLIKYWRPDVIHGFLFDGNIYSRVAAIGCRVPVLNSERSSGYQLRKIQRMVHRPTRFLADGLIANSFVGAAHAAELFAISVDDVHVVWNGIDPAALNELVANEGMDCREEFFAGEQGVYLAVMVANIVVAKDYDLALDTAQALIALDPRWRVLFVGASFSDRQLYRMPDADQSDSYAVGIRQRFEAMPERSKIRFSGRRSDAVRLIAQADVLFSTSLHEGFPNVVLEAMAVGTPVVATNYSDIRRILPNDWQIVPSRDPRDLAGLIVRARACRAAVAKAQRKWVHENATVALAVARLVAVYSKYVRQADRLDGGAP